MRREAVAVVLMVNCVIRNVRTVTRLDLSAFEHLQGPHHQRHIRCLSGVRSGSTLRRASVQLSKTSDATHSARSMGQPGRGADFLNLNNDDRRSVAGLSQQQQLDLTHAC